MDGEHNGWRSNHCKASRNLPGAGLLKQLDLIPRGLAALYSGALLKLHPIVRLFVELPVGIDTAALGFLDLMLFLCEPSPRAFW
jgi:hypothetical protein